MWDELFSNYLIFLLLFARMMGMFMFNPFFGRRNVPVIIKMGMAFFTALILISLIPAGTVVKAESILVFMLLCAKELFIGFTIGFIMQLFLAALHLAGDFMDLQLGIGMAKVYDPQSNVSMPISGSIFNLLYVVLFFVTNGHLNLMKIMVATLQLLPLGTWALNPECGEYVALLFSNILVLAIKLALPVVAIEIITELALGVLMRTVPQINVFAVGLQLKLLVGLVLIVMVLPGVFDVFDNLTNTMLKTIMNGIKLMV